MEEKINIVTPLMIVGSGKVPLRDAAKDLVEYFFNMEDRDGGKYSTVFGVKTNFEKQMSKMMRQKTAERI